MGVLFLKRLAWSALYRRSVSVNTLLVSNTIRPECFPMQYNGIQKCFI